jgi:hypothetical protein
MIQISGLRNPALQQPIRPIRDNTMEYASPKPALGLNQFLQKAYPRSHR